MTITSFEDIVAWQKSRELYLYLYGQMKDSREYVYKDQLLRASLSIMNNIAEGFDRGSTKELRQFLIIARGSAAEVRSMLWIAKDLHLIDDKELHRYQQIVKEISRLLTGFIKSLNRQQITDN